MAFFFIVGTKDFTKPLPGHEGITAQCHNCGNWAAHPIQSWDWFTFCWVPIIPLGSKHKDLACSICRFRQDLRNRPDVGSQQGQGAMMPQQGPPQGWNNPPPPPHGSGGMPPGPQQPQYK